LVSLLSTVISFLTRSRFPAGTFFVTLQETIMSPIKINNDIFVTCFFNGLENLIQKYIFLWLVKTK
jgi:hypothetical protein